MDALRSDIGATALRMAVAVLALWSGFATSASTVPARAAGAPAAGAIGQPAPAETRTELTTVLESLRSTLDKVAQNAGAAKTPGEQVRPQLDPNRPPASVYKDAAHIDYAILAVPDPRVPRHRRSYEQALRSVIAGMSDSQYVLDRYYFPWQDYAGDRPPSQNDRWTTKDQIDDGRYGVLVFRRDDWRAQADLSPSSIPPRYTLRVLHVVPETVTAGMQYDALRNAVNDIVDEVEGNAIDVQFRAASTGPDPPGDPDAPDEDDEQRRDRYLKPPQASGGVEARAGRLLLIGPNFSSSIGNVERIARALIDSGRVVVPHTIRSQLEPLRKSVERMTSDVPAEPRCGRDAVRSYRRFYEDFARLVDERSDTARQRVAQGVPAAAARCAGAPALEVAKIVGRVSGYFATTSRDFSQHRGVVAFSPSATVESNAAINLLSYRIFEFHSLAADDHSKVVALLEYFDASADVDPEAPIALLYEISSFGLGVYASLRTELDAQELGLARREAGDGAKDARYARPRRLMGAAFPPNIADLRKHRRAEDEAAKRKAGVIDLSTESFLSIEEGAENGNEYPDGGSSQLTPVAAEQQLRHLLTSLRREPKPPGIVIVAATDVRDRLYLFDRISHELPNAQLVDLEADVLLGHPDYVHATRGALMMSSALLSSVPLSQQFESTSIEPLRSGVCDLRKSATYENSAQRYSFDSDRQALLYELVRCLDHDVLRSPAPLLYRIGRNGPALLGSGRAVYDSIRHDASLSLRSARLYGSSALLFAFGLLLCAGWKAFRREDWQDVSRERAERRRARGAARAAVGVVPLGVALHAGRAPSRVAKLPPADVSKLRNGEIAGAPWQTHRRASVGLVTSYLGAIVIALFAVGPFSEQYVNIRSYFDAPTAGSVSVAWLALWPLAIVAIVLGVGRRVYLARSRNGKRPGAMAPVAGVAAGAAVLVVAGLVSWPVLSTPARVPPATLLWALHFDLWIVAVMALVLLLALTRRVKRWTFYAEVLIRSAQDGKELGDWAKIEGPKPRFVATPIEAGLHRNMYETRAMRPIADLRREIAAIETGFCDSLAARMALRRLFWPSLNAVALTALAIVSCYFGILLLAWLYPVSGRGVPLMIGMLVAVAGTVLLVSNAIAFERSALLSRLFCGTDKGLQISSQLLTIVMGPVLLLLLSIVAADQPGVLEWSGGIVKILTGGR